MKHLFIQGKEKNGLTLLLLHGTGGTEQDLLPIAEMVAPEANVLSVRGNVSENGMPRFFRRLAEGVFDEEDLIFRTNELNEFVNEQANVYGFDRSNVIAIGYSNGANIAASMLFHHKDSLKGAILYHAMVPRRGISLPELKDVSVFIGAGEQDPMIPAEQTKELAELLRQAGANVEEFWQTGGHQLTRDEVVESKKWLETYLT
ncbi:alpha/beta hydrolase [Bacillus suaedae]|uniref:Alpha/beta hydrolase n=1 Tax=Halalkalibacter suaedae TaxID=2822140 RepID=A0A940WQA2_9BACI|nr:alpha/beta hydrolase [Bacillus suaedae]MBP3950371.1 alpha/beta hydrolase [Bacillus suaedae]